MDISMYQKKIMELVATSQDIDYLVAVYSFASNYPDKSKKPDRGEINQKSSH